MLLERMSKVAGSEQGTFEIVKHIEIEKLRCSGVLPMPRQTIPNQF